MQIRIDGFDLPGKTCGPSPERPGGHHNIHVGVQHKKAPDDIYGLTSAEAESASWLLDITVKQTDDGLDFGGPFVQGKRGDRFIYLSWGVVEQPGSFEMFRRAKLRLTEVPEPTMSEAITSGLLIGRLGLTDQKGNPLCASVKPGAIEWSVGAG